VTFVGLGPVTGLIGNRGKIVQTQKAPPRGWRFAVLRWSLASQAIGARWLYPLSLLQAVPAGNSLFEGPLDWRFLLPGVCVHWAGRIRFQQPVHHWRLLHSNPCTVRLLFYFQQVMARLQAVNSAFLEGPRGGNTENCRELSLSLAAGAKMRSAAGDQGPPDRCLAGDARLAGALIHAVLELEEAAPAIGVDIIRYR
jgi:hypothetical protein